MARHGRKGRHGRKHGGYHSRGWGSLLDYMEKPKKPRAPRKKKEPALPSIAEAAAVPGRKIRIIKKENKC